MSDIDIVEQVGKDIEKLLPPEMCVQWPTLWAAMKEVQAEVDKLRADLIEARSTISSTNARLEIERLRADLASARAQERERIAIVFEKRRDEFALENLTIDPETGCEEGTDARIAFVNDLNDVIDAIRALTDEEQ